MMTLFEPTPPEYLIDTPNIKIKNATVGFIVIGAVAVWILVGMIADRYGNEEIGSYFERNEYTTQYWVYLQPSNDSVKNYRTKGDIQHYKATDYDSSWSAYSLNRVYWDNGGYIDFDDCDISDATAKNGSAYCRYDDNTSYTIRLGEKVK